MTKIAVADDSEVIRNLIEEILRYEPGLELEASFENGPEIVAWTREGGRADIYLIDMRLPGLSGTGTIRALRRFLDNERIIAFSASAQESSISSALEAGANRYVVKDSSLHELIDAIRSPTGDVVPGEAAVKDVPARSSGDVEPATVAARTDAEQDDSARHFTVMVVDDHEIVRETTAALLESRGLGTACFASGEDALAWIEGGGRPEAALVDLRLGGGRDTTLLTRLRAQLPEAVIFVHSGVSNAEGEQVAASAGADGFIAKGELSASSLEQAITQKVASRTAPDK